MCSDLGTTSCFWASSTLPKKTLGMKRTSPENPLQHPDHLRVPGAPFVLISGARNKPWTRPNQKRFVMKEALTTVVQSLEGLECCCELPKCEHYCPNRGNRGLSCAGVKARSFARLGRIRQEVSASTHKEKAHQRFPDCGRERRCALG